MTKNKHGFTLIELVVVMAIIAILAALMVAAILAARNQATTTQRVGNVKTLETGLESWATKNSGKYPHAADPAALNTLLKTDGALSSEVSGVENINYYWFDDGSATTKATHYILFACDSKGSGTLGKTGTLGTDAAGSGCTGTIAYTAQR